MLLDWFHAVYFFIFTHRRVSSSILFELHSDHLFLLSSDSLLLAAYKDEDMKSKKIIIGLITTIRVPRVSHRIHARWRSGGERWVGARLSNFTMIGFVFRARLGNCERVAETTNGEINSGRWVMRSWLRWILVPREMWFFALLVYENFSIQFYWRLLQFMGTFTNKKQIV